LKLAKYFTFLIIVLLLPPCIVSNNIIGNSLKETEEAKNILYSEIGKVSYTTLGMISIDGNSNFLSTASSNGWTGSGLISDPIIIKDIQITGQPFFTSFSIKNTNLYFRIENSYFNIGYIGIYLENSSNSIIQNNIVENIDNGIFYDHLSLNVVVRNNVI
jgi:parallel beta-helix repeat protein